MARVGIGATRLFALPPTTPDLVRAYRYEEAETDWYGDPDMRLPGPNEQDAAALAAEEDRERRERARRRAAAGKLTKREKRVRFLQQRRAGRAIISDDSSADDDSDDGAPYTETWPIRLQRVATYSVPGGLPTVPPVEVFGAHNEDAAERAMGGALRARSAVLWLDYYTAHPPMPPDAARRLYVLGLGIAGYTEWWWAVYRGAAAADVAVARAACPSVQWFVGLKNQSDGAAEFEGDSAQAPSPGVYMASRT